MENTYIPYSKRHDISDQELAGLLDYVERVMGWDIFPKENYKLITHIISKGKSISILQRDDGDISINYHHDDYFYQFATMERYIFFRSYKTILPVIRDLYRNQLPPGLINSYYFSCNPYIGYDEQYVWLLKQNSRV